MGGSSDIVCSRKQKLRLNSIVEIKIERVIMMDKNIVIIIGLLLIIFQHSNSQDTGSSHNLTGMPFPHMTVETLSGKTIHYPDSLNGTVSLILIAFERETQEKIDTWLLPFSEKFSGADDVSFYEIPMLKWRWKIISPIIDGGMRSGIPVERHGNVTTYYGNISKYRTPLHMSDTADAYIFLLDKNGIIQWHSNGYATIEKLKNLYEVTGIMRKVSVN